MKKIIAELKRYNANTRDSYVGDCVKRSLTIAYGLDYDEVSKELNRIKRDKGVSAYNISPVYNEFLKRRNAVFRAYPEKGVTVSNFADEHSSGTYLLLTGSPSLAARGVSNHMVAIIDGDIWDSWDSSNEVVVSYLKVSNTGTAIAEVRIDDILDDLLSYASEYCSSLSTKFPYGDVSVRGSQRSDRYTAEFYVAIKFGSKLPEGYAWFENRLKMHTIVVKLNPTADAEANLRSLQAKCKQKIYDWVYNIRKELQDAEQSQTLEVNPNFRGNRADLMKVPEWARPLVTRFWDEGSGGYTERYQVYMDALPDDPRGARDPEVVFYADTLSELKRNMNDYKENYYRFGYDY